MTSQPLETIPEAPTPAPAPARVTADPPKTKPAKNPGRVASGKRLAERNRLAREALARETEAKAKAAEPTPTKTEDSASDSSSSSSSSLSLGAMLGIGSLIVGVGGLYFQREAIMARLKARTSTAGTSKTRGTGTVSHSGETRPKENGLSFENTIYTFTMERFVHEAAACQLLLSSGPYLQCIKVNKAWLWELFGCC